MSRLEGVLLRNRCELADHHLNLLGVLLFCDKHCPLPLCVELYDLVGLAKLERFWYMIDLLVRLGGFVVAAKDEDVLVVVQSDDGVAETASKIDALHRLDLDLGLLSALFLSREFERHLFEGKGLGDIIAKSEEATTLVAANRVEFELSRLCVFEEAVDDEIALGFVALGYPDILRFQSFILSSLLCSLLSCA